MWSLSFEHDICFCLYLFGLLTEMLCVCCLCALCDKISKIDSVRFRVKDTLYSHLRRFNCAIVRYLLHNVRNAFFCNYNLLRVL